MGGGECDVEKRAFATLQIRPLRRDGDLRLRWRRQVRLQRDARSHRDRLAEDGSLRRARKNLLTATSARPSPKTSNISKKRTMSDPTHLL
jgi:hypothetical protein